jgi:hypothetical protein
LLDGPPSAERNVGEGRARAGMFRSRGARGAQTGAVARAVSVLADQHRLQSKKILQVIFNGDCRTLIRALNGDDQDEGEQDVLRDART